MSLSLDGTTGISASGNITGGNVIASGSLVVGSFTPSSVSTAGNITGSYIIGNGSQLTGLPAGYSNSNLATLGSNVISTTGTITGGNITGSNILTGGLISATGSITGASVVGGVITGSSISVTGAVTGASVVGGVMTGTSVSVTGAVSGASTSVTGTTTAASVVGGVITGSSLSVTGTINGTTVTGTSLTVTTGNLTGGNLLLSGAIEDSGQLDIRTTASNGNIVLTPNGTGNVNTGANISATGSIVTGGNLNLIGNIVDTGPLTVITSSNGNITLAPNGTGVVIVNTDIRNGQASGIGNIGATGAVFNTIFAKATSAQYADLAEMYCADSEYTPGTVLDFGGTEEVTTTTQSHSTQVAGIVSTNPSYLMNSTLTCTNAVQVALVGRVPCHVVGTIAKGDRLVASSTPGIATRLDMSQYQPGCIIGKALEAYDSETVGTIEVAVGRI
jgi:hypothetical protein